MYKGSMSLKVLASVSVGVMWVAGCGGAEVNGGSVPAQVKQRVTSAVSPVAAGRYHGLAVRNGSVWSWGHNVYYQLGDGTTPKTEDRTLPAQLQVQSGGLPVSFASVAAGEYHSMALDSTGHVWTWGAPTTGRLGLGLKTTELPSELTCNADPTLLGCGRLPAQVPSLSNVVAISAHGYSSLSMALKSTGEVYAWGFNTSGQSGNGTTSTETPSPVQVLREDTSQPLTDVVAIAAGGVHGAAVRADGSLWVWGGNGAGQLGEAGYVNGTKVSYRTKAVQVSLPVGTTAVDVSAGLQVTLALLSDGTVYGFGSTTSGQLGTSTSPGRVSAGSGSTSGSPYLTGVSRLASGHSHSLAVTSSGLWGWGTNSSYQLGVGSTLSRFTPVQPVVVIPGWSYVAGGEDFSMAMDGNGDVWTWGSNNHGKLGRITAATSNGTPTQLSFSTSTP
ncbi:hypothetical protein F0U60_29025 [Archangium minus]|uniref:BNR repeat domain protein n=1 Tax=Archangium minus TaxID=83450 RepID=A0ABY9WX78_9BACT|nr:hypothetical protein F0U60_29025 [Archangium minus]